MSVKPAALFRISAALAVAGLGASLIASAALAQATSSRMQGLQLSNDQPIQIESDKLEIKDPESKAIFTGNVKVVQGTTTLQAGNMTVFYKAGPSGFQVVKAFKSILVEDVVPSKTRCRRGHLQ